MDLEPVSYTSLSLCSQTSIFQKRRDVGRQSIDKCLEEEWPDFSNLLKWLIEFRIFKSIINLFSPQSTPRFCSTQLRSPTCTHWDTPASSTFMSGSFHLSYLHLGSTCKHSRFLLCLLSLTPVPPYKIEPLSWELVFLLHFVLELLRSDPTYFSSPSP